MSDHDIAVSVRGLSKSYTIAHNAPKHTTIGEAIVHTLKGLGQPLAKPEKETFWALNDVGFDIQKGEVVGIIGRNGAGKSTLLKILSRITEPTTGQIDIYGRVGSLLEVGTGFHPELTGRENIFMNGAILGMSRQEISRNFDAIVDFSGTEKFLDTPVKRYSSGMYVRLAFAVAAHLNPEILIVDEVLAVGDAEFQRKCLGKMRDVASSGRTILFVSHNMTAVQALCSRCILMQNGGVKFDGDVTAATFEYQSAARPLGVEGVPGEYDLTDRHNQHAAGKRFIRKMTIRDSRGKVTDSLPMGDGMTISVEIEGLAEYPDAKLGIRISSESDQLLADFNTGMKPPLYGRREDKECFTMHVPRTHFMPGSYRIGLAVATNSLGLIDFIEYAGSLHILEFDLYGSGHPMQAGHCIMFMDAEWQVSAADTYSSLLTTA